MSCVLYEFSATGNCLTTARLLEKEWDDCHTVPIASLKDCNEIHVLEDVVGFVFPIYYGDMPCLVRNVIKHMHFKEDAYIFAFATYRGHPGDIAKRMDNLLRERQQTLSLCTGIPMPGNSYISTKEQIEDTLKNQRKNILEAIVPILQQKKEDYSVLEDVEDSPISHLWNMRGIKADEHCIGCGLCTKVCPMNNIKLVDKHAVIGDSCLTCLACFHWCPQEAIYMSKEKDIARREKYHHPDIKVVDIIKQKKSSYLT